LGGTSVRLGQVAVVAGFKPFIAFDQVATQNAIAAARQPAIVAASVGVFNIPIIAGLAFVEQPVTAAQGFTARRTIVVVGIIAVVTFFVVLGCRMQVAAVDPIAAARQGAAIKAGVVLFKITIIASLVLWIIVAQVSALSAIAAGRQSAGV
jgi:hypothetical protein